MSDDNSLFKLHDIWQDDVLSFWFEELTPKQWYQSTKSVNDTIRNRFEQLIASVSEHPASSFGNNAEKLLAATIVLDQFPRNIYRGSPKAFAYDQLALDLAVHTVSEGLDNTMDDSQRQFCYMPFMHSENLDAQNRSVELFNTLGVKGGIDAAVEHREIIVEFGRFPHRNAVLERPSTAEETQYLANAKRFGQ